jgi:hypothetical protein
VDFGGSPAKPPQSRSLQFQLRVSRRQGFRSCGYSELELPLRLPLRCASLLSQAPASLRVASLPSLRSSLTSCPRYAVHPQSRSLQFQLRVPDSQPVRADTRNWCEPRLRLYFLRKLSVAALAARYFLPAALLFGLVSSTLARRSAISGC